ncbi:MAG: glycosyltransferase family 2 protein [Alphaproteobacteria bacterium]
MTQENPIATPSGSRRGSVTVVCPFYNEEAIIRTAAEVMVAKLSECFDDWELILVDDGSTDGSLAEILAFRDSLEAGRVAVISYQPNRGRGHALRQGIDAARGDIIVTTEVDLSWGENIVPQLFDALAADETAHFVIASPNLSGVGYIEVPISRRLISRLGNKLIGLFFSGGITMHTGMTRAYRSEIIKPLQFKSDGKEFHLEVLLKLLTLGFNAIEIPAAISWEIRNKTARRQRPGAHVLNRRMLGTISSHLLFIALARPMAYFGVISAIAVLGGILFALAAIWNLLTGGVSAFFAVISMLLFLFGVLFTGFAVVFTLLRELSRDNWLRAYPNHRELLTKVTRHDSVDR